MLITAEQAGGIFRAVGLAVVAYLAGKGVIATGVGNDIVAALATCIVSVWSTWTNRPAA